MESIFKEKSITRRFDEPLRCDMCGMYIPKYEGNVIKAILFGRISLTIQLCDKCLVEYKKQMREFR